MRYMTSEMKNYLKWVKANRVIPDGVNPKDARPPSIYPLSHPLTNPLGGLFDHGFVVGRVCCAPNSIEGVEFAVVSRTYVSDDEIDNPPDGLRTLRLPYKEDHGQAVITYPVGPGKGTNLFLRYLQELPAKHYDAALPLYMSDYSIAISHNPDFYGCGAHVRLVSRHVGEESQHVYKNGDPQPWDDNLRIDVGRVLKAFGEDAPETPPMSDVEVVDRLVTRINELLDLGALSSDEELKILRATIRSIKGFAAGHFCPSIVK